MSNTFKGLIVLLLAAAVATGGYFVAKGSKSPTTTTSTLTPVTTPGSAACQGANFTGVLDSGQGAAGTIYTTVTFKNLGAKCTIIGWAGLAFFDGSHKSMNAGIVQSGSYFARQGGVPSQPSTFSVAHNGTAKFALAYSDVPVGAQQSCPTVVSFDVNLPNAVVSVHPVRVSGGGALVLCGSGNVWISPFYR